VTTIIASGERLTLHDPRLHVRIEADLRSKIAAGRLRPGQALPTIHQLRQTYGCCRQTAARPLQRMLDAGLLIRYPGLGYYVR
jgi:DNA-binding GntR family transcriptional regulator